MKPTAVRLWEAGYHHLVCVIPPDAPLSPQSRVQPAQRGKTPGRRNTNGTWGGYAWLTEPCPTLPQVKKWADDGANIGLLAAAFPGVDIDTLDPWLASEVETIAKETLGSAPCRVGKAPKRLLMYRTGEPFARMAVIIHRDGEKHLVEVLGAGRQYLIEGVHPSGVRYTWDRDIASINPESDLTRITKEHVEHFFQVLAERLEALEMRVERVGDGAIRARGDQPQADLLAPSMDALQAAVDLIPNTDDLFANSRADYIKTGYAIRAAAGDEQEEAGFDCFASWAGRCEGTRDKGTPDDWRADWRRMQPPYSVGWTWIAEIASAFGFQRATYDFTADPIEAVRAEHDEGPAAFSDQWLTERVLEEAGDRLRFVNAFGRWYVWSEGRWVPDAVLLADHIIATALRRQAALVLRRGATEKESKTSQKLAVEMCSSGKLSAVRQLLRADPRIAAPAYAFDSDPWLLNTPAGIIDLRSGQMKDHDPAVMCSRQTVAAPDADMPAPEWERFLMEATSGDVLMQSYLQRLAGYALTGRTDEHTVAFVWGPGGNGKSVFANTLQHVLRDYAETAAMDTFTATSADRHPTDLAGLVGARLVVASETQAGRKWDEQRLKAVTGGDPVKARYMRQDFFTYTPQYLLLFIGNHKPQITNVDEAMRRRIHLVPFTVTPKAKDELLSEKLRAEAPAILAWAIKGCLRWQQEKLNPPPVIVEATAEYFEEEDAIGRFLADECLHDAESMTMIEDLYRRWLEWSNERGERPGSMKRFSQLLASRHYERTRDVKTRRSAIKGIALLPDSLMVGAED